MCENVLPSLQELVVGASRVHGHSRVNDNKTINNCYSSFMIVMFCLMLPGPFLHCTRMRGQISRNKSMESWSCREDHSTTLLLLLRGWIG